MKYPPAFEVFWRAYPKRDGPNPKGEAFGEWGKCLKAGHTEAEMEHGAAAYAQSVSGNDAKFIVHARRFLRNRWFDDYADAEIIKYRDLTAEETAAWAWSSFSGTGKARVGKTCFPPGHKIDGEAVA